MSSSVRGYHVYHDIWTAVVGEELPCAREATNTKDRYAVGVLKDDTIVGHLPKNISHCQQTTLAPEIHAAGQPVFQYFEFQKYSIFYFRFF